MGILNVKCRMTIYRLIESGDLPAVKVGPKLYRIERAELQKFIERGRTAA